MVSSRMRSALPFKPTPSTCFPPLPDPPPGGFNPCTGKPWSLASTMTHGAFITHSGLPLIVPYWIESTNDSRVTKATGYWAWATTLDSSTHERMQIGLRCLGSDYGTAAWQGFMMGSVITQDGTRLTGSKTWQAVVATVSNPTGLSTEVRCTIGAPPQWQQFPWGMMGGVITLREVSAFSRSRPPKPMIPPLA